MYIKSEIAKLLEELTLLLGPLLWLLVLGYTFVERRLTRIGSKWIALLRGLRHVGPEGVAWGLAHALGLGGELVLASEKSVDAEGGVLGRSVQRRVLLLGWWHVREGVPVEGALSWVHSAHLLEALCITVSLRSVRAKWVSRLSSALVAAHSRHALVSWW